MSPTIRTRRETRTKTGCAEKETETETGTEPVKKMGRTRPRDEDASYHTPRGDFVLRTNDEDGRARRRMRAWTFPDGAPFFYDGFLFDGFPFDGFPFPGSRDEGDVWIADDVFRRDAPPER